MQYLKFIFKLIFLSFIIFTLIIIGIIYFPKNVFDSNYNSLIQEKFEILKSTNEPKIIILAGSSSAFGLNQVMLEEATGYKVANLGLHAGFGYLFISELAKANINKGDIILLGYEYGWYNEGGFTNSSADLIMTGIDDNIEMYAYLPPSILKNCLGYLFSFASQKNSYTNVTGIYSREAFDSTTGQMTMKRNSHIEYDKEKDGFVNIDNFIISDSSIKYLKNLKNFVENKGASIYFISPPTLKDSITCDYSEFTKLKEMEEKQIGIKYISDPIQYFYPNELMFDTIYHCNSLGENIRTKMLINDLKAADIIK